MFGEKGSGHCLFFLSEFVYGIELVVDVSGYSETELNESYEIIGFMNIVCSDFLQIELLFL